MKAAGEAAEEKSNRENLAGWNFDLLQNTKEYMKCQVCGGSLEVVVTDMPFKIGWEAIVILKGV